MKIFNIVWMSLFLTSATSFASADALTDEEAYRLYVVGACYNDSLFVEQIAEARDEKMSARRIQDTMIKKVETNKRLDVADLIFGFLLVEMVYDRVGMTPTQLRDASYKSCLSTYNVKVE